jgi:hypothetical protein
MEGPGLGHAGLARHGDRCPTGRAERAALVARRLRWGLADLPSKHRPAWWRDLGEGHQDAPASQAHPRSRHAGDPAGAPQALRRACGFDRSGGRTRGLRVLAGAGLLDPTQTRLCDPAVRPASKAARHRYAFPRTPALLGDGAHLRRSRSTYGRWATRPQRSRRTFATASTPSTTMPITGPRWIDLAVAS